MGLRMVQTRAMWPRRLLRPTAAFGASSVGVVVGVLGALATVGVFSPIDAAAVAVPRAASATTVVRAAAAASVPPAMVARYEVRTRTENYVDTSRRTAANGKFRGSKQRSLPTMILQPVATRDGERFPLFVFSHGLGGEPASYNTLLRAIAGQGYIVAAPTFPLTNQRTPGGPNLLDEANQPADVRFVIDQMLKADNASAPVLDRTQIGAGGHSLGAITTIDLIGNSCCFDNRVKAAVSVAGSANIFRAAKMFDTPAVALLFVHGDQDPTVPYTLGYSTYKAAKAPKHFVTVVGGGHLFDLVNDPASRERVGAAIGVSIVDFLDAQLKGEGTFLDGLKSVMQLNPGLLKVESVIR